MKKRGRGYHEGPNLDIRSELVVVWDCGKEKQERGAGCKERGGSLHCTLRHTTIMSTLVGVGGVLVVSQQVLSSCSQSLGLDEEKLRSRTSLHLYS